MNSKAKLILLIFILQTSIKTQNILRSNRRVKWGDHSQEKCPRIKGIQDPVLIFHLYFKQTMNVFNPKESRTSVDLIHYQEVITDISTNIFIFKIKNTYTTEYDYVGIVSIIPENELRSGNNKHYIIRYINSKDIQDVMILIGVFDFENKKPLPCSKPKKRWLEYLMKNPYVLTSCKGKNIPTCDVVSDKRMLFLDMLNFIQNLLSSFSINVTLKDINYNEVILNEIEDGFRDFDFIRVNIL